MNTTPHLRKAKQKQGKQISKERRGRGNAQEGGPSRERSYHRLGDEKHNRPGRRRPQEIQYPDPLLARQRTTAFGVGDVEHTGLRGEPTRTVLEDLGAAGLDEEEVHGNGHDECDYHVDCLV